jgi:hypothetical protein
VRQGGWAWVIDRDRVYRSVCVCVTLDTLSLAGSVAQETLDAIDSKGRSQVDKVLSLDEPPQRILMGFSGYLGESPPARSLSGQVCVCGRSDHAGR